MEMIIKKIKKTQSSSSLLTSNNSQTSIQQINDNKLIKNNLKNFKNNNIKKNQSNLMKPDSGNLNKSNKNNSNLTFSEKNIKNNNNIKNKSSDIGKNKVKVNDKKTIKTIKNSINSSSSSSLESLISLDKLSNKTQTSLPPLTSSSFSCIDLTLDKKGNEYGKINDTTFSKLNGIQRNIGSTLLRPIPQHH
ncbi:hypothetical protein BCR32DRAFT_326216 [Anaeromyces robustus]|uniref:Uncharacterized protein n=1 Tax=Anaeromyces robustus TaxID=1754192 RepID=A0A1Y1XEA0_9FUNG|nr:hypothetical protein BCR32DRAFT_326216 [Anaeromyces robustus]|eukprot:ORX83776.1 hypothetical protein BCR32DRAFT_326216 [Anaeromyces robustus]